MRDSLLTDSYVACQLGASHSTDLSRRLCKHPGAVHACTQISAVQFHFVMTTRLMGSDLYRIKQNYRDVILFFKVGKFYELYEDDAQIGADALEWKMTITGVGHCRQVS